MADGYIYCFSNISMVGIVKVGMTERTPDIRLSEANNSDTWRPPTPYKMEFAKKVSNHKQKELALHNILTQYTERINPKREFFRASPEEVRQFIDLMDGEVWVEKQDLITDEAEAENVDTVIALNSNKGCRNMVECFRNNQRIRHVIGVDNIWIGIYNSSKNEIMYNDTFYKSLSGFAEAHYVIETDKAKSTNGWKECECEVDNLWISTFNL
jgi:hypothetical protein